jgi:exosortase
MAARHHWLHPAAALAVFLGYVPFFRSTVQLSATEHHAGHVIFVPVFAVILVWVDRHRLRGLIGRGEASGAIVTGLALALVAVAYRWESVPLQAVSFVLAIGGLLVWCYGKRILRGTGYVLLLLLFMSPPSPHVVSTVVPSLQHFVAVFTSTVLDALRIPVERHGVLLMLPEITLEVAEECAGLRFVLILLVFASALARIALPTISSQLTLVALSVPVAILANAARVASMSAGAHVIGLQVIKGPLHFHIGKGFWVLGLVVLIAMARILRSARVRRVVRSCLRGPIPPRASPARDIGIRAHPHGGSGHSPQSPTRPPGLSA